jgi:hypothetical protein
MLILTYPNTVLYTVLQHMRMLCVQINLSALLDMSVEPGSGLYAGFTAATGRAWAKHDVLSWYWCHENSCEEDQTQEWLEVTPLTATLCTMM